jgi:hypothetical protein
MRSLLLVEGFDLRPSNQYILVRLIPTALVPGRTSVKLQPEILDSFIFGGGGRGAHGSVVVEALCYRLEDRRFDSRCGN